MESHPGIYNRTGKGVTRLCRICHTPFTVGKTFLYCGTCSFIIQSKNYQLLSPRQKKIFHNYNNYHGRKQYVSRHLDYFLEYTKGWRKSNPRKKYVQKKKETDRYNKETLMVANNYYQRWTSDEIAYIQENKEDKTARQIAMDLGRTYNTIIVRACLEKIPLMTEDKKHMRLVTG